MILVSRNPDALGEYARRGAEVRKGDFGDPSTLTRAFAGGERMLLISTTGFGSRIAHHAAAIEAAARAGVDFVAYTSFVRPDKAKPAGLPAEHSATEKTLRASVDGADGSDKTRMIQLGRYGTFHGDQGYAASLATTTGMPPEAAKMFESFGLAIRAGLLDLVTSAVEDLTGRPPRTFRSVLEAQLAGGVPVGR